MKVDETKDYPLKSKITLGICFSAFVFGTLFTVFPSYFPVLAEDRGFSETVISLAFMTKFLVCFLVGMHGSRYVSKMGRKATLILGVFMHVRNGFYT